MCGSCRKPAPSRRTPNNQSSYNYPPATDKKAYDTSREAQKNRIMGIKHVPK